MFGHGPTSQRPKRHFDRFGRFCRARASNQETHKHTETDHATSSVAVGRILVLWVR